MGFLDVIMGRRKLAGPAPDRLFAISTAYVKFETELAISSAGRAAIVFQPLATADFESIVTEMEQVVQATCSDSHTTVRTSDDKYDFRWLILEGTSFDDLVVGINAVSSSLEAGGYGERLLCAVFAFQDRQQRKLSWIYNFKRGAFYPFVPAAGSGESRDTEREFVLKAQVGNELPVEQEIERWFPLWGIPI